MKLSIVKQDRQKIYDSLPNMTNQQRVKLYKKLWYQYHKYSKRGELSKANYYDHVMDRVRIYKKHSVAYRKMVRKHLRLIRHKDERRYARTHMKHMEDLSRRYYHTHLNKYRKSNARRARAFYHNHTSLCRKRTNVYYWKHHQDYIRYAHKQYADKIKKAQK